jgi:hypothetical protein
MEIPVQEPLAVLRNSDEMTADPNVIIWSLLCFSKLSV